MLTSIEYQERTEAEIIEIEIREAQVNVEISRLLGIAGDLARLLRAMHTWAFEHLFQFVFPAIALLTGIGVAGIARKR